MAELVGGVATWPVVTGPRTRIEELEVELVTVVRKTAEVEGGKSPDVFSLTKRKHPL